MTRWNRSKLESIIERRQQLHAALLSVGKRRDTARERMAHAERRLREAMRDAEARRGRSLNKDRIDVSVPRDIQARAREARAEVERLDFEYQAAAQRFREHAAVAERLASYAEQRFDYKRSQTSFIVRGTE